MVDENSEVLSNHQTKKLLFIFLIEQRQCYEMPKKVMKEGIAVQPLTTPINHIDIMTPLEIQ